MMVFLGNIKDFLSNVHPLIIASAPSHCTREVDNIHQILVLLTGRALIWVTTTFSYTTLSQSYAKFEREIQEVFDNSESGKDAGQCLLALKQSPAITFCMLAAESGWNKPVLKTSFL